MPKSRILVVENEAAVALAICSQLTEIGCETIGHTATGEEALLLAEERRPDLVLMDVKPDGSMDRVAAASTLRERLDIPVIFLTACAEETAVAHTKSAQLYGYLQKPTQPTALRLAIELALTRHQADATLRSHLQEQSDILQAAMDGFCRIDLQGRIIEVNDTYCRMTGYSRAELIQRSVTDLDSDESPTQFSEMIGHIQESGSARFQRRHRRKDGTHFDVEVSAQYRTPGSGCCVAFLRDITERKTAERVVSNARTRYQRLLETASDGIHILNPQGQLVEASPSFYRMLGYEPEAPPLRHVSDWDAQWTPEELAARLASLLKQPALFETQHRCRDGHTIEVEIHVHAVHLDG